MSEKRIPVGVGSMRHPRRVLLMSVAAVAVMRATATRLPDASPSRVEHAAVEPVRVQAFDGYRLSPHVARYYQTARV